MSTDILVTVLSWEQRFILGLEDDISKHKPSKVLLFKYNNPLTEKWKKENYLETKKRLGNKLIEVSIEVSKPNENWFTFLRVFSKYCKNKQVVIDLTTMTRESIWFSLFNCKINFCDTTYVYHKPSEYPGEWISRDPGKPRLLYKMSGIAKLGAPTLLLVTAGYDIERLDNLIYCFEPLKTIVFLANGKNKRNIENSEKCKELLNKKYNIKSFFQYDPYDVKASYDIILEKLFHIDKEKTDSYLDSHNIILNSLGAKPSAITLFNIWLKYPEVALSYIPSKEYNREYSTGIEDSLIGKIDF